MKTHTRYLAFAFAFVGMAMTMPSCPGQQAMQQQIDDLTSSKIEVKRNLVTLDTGIKAANADIAALKAQVEALSKAVQDQAAQNQAAMKAMDDKLTAALAKPAPAPAKKRKH